MPRRKAGTKNSLTLSGTPTPAENSTSCESDSEEELSDNRVTNNPCKAPAPSGVHRRNNKQRHGKYSYDDSESDGAEDTNIYRKPSIALTNEKIHPSTGITCKQHIRYPSCTRIRTLYSQFPRDYGRLILLHLFSTIILYLMIYPVVNFFWTYLINVDDEVATLFHYITEEPTYEGGYFKHFRRMKWLRWPQVSAESLALLIATIVKDTAILHWEGVMEDMSLTNIVGNHIAKRYGR